MARIEQPTRTAASLREPSQAALHRLHGGACWTASFRESGHDGHAPLRPEDVARSEVYFNSTGCWV
jgi:hypothetical protein